MHESHSILSAFVISGPQFIIVVAYKQFNGYSNPNKKLHATNAIHPGHLFVLLVWSKVNGINSTAFLFFIDRLLCHSVQHSENCFMHFVYSRCTEYRKLNTNSFRLNGKLLIYRFIGVFSRAEVKFTRIFFLAPESTKFRTKKKTN